MALEYPDILKRANSTKPIVDGDDVRGVNREVENLTEMYGLAIVADKLRENVTRVYVKQLDVSYILKDIEQVDNITGWELVADVDLSGIEVDIETLQNTVQYKAEKGQANGYAGLDSGAKLPTSVFPDELLGNVRFRGLYDGTVVTSQYPSYNGNPLPAPTTVNAGIYFIVTAPFTREGIDYKAKDWIVSLGTTGYDIIDNSDSVSTVFGRMGNVIANTGDYSVGQITGAAPLASPTFTGVVTSPIFVGALTGNATTATTLATSRTIFGQNFNGSANVTGALSGATTIDATGRITATLTTEQLRLAYDATNNAKFTTSNDGNLTIAPTGGLTTFTGNGFFTGSISAGSNITALNGRIEARSTSVSQLRASNTASIYTDFTTNSSGNLTIAPTGGQTSVTGNALFSGRVGIGSVVASDANLFNNAQLNATITRSSTINPTISTSASLIELNYTAPTVPTGVTIAGITYYQASQPAYVGTVGTNTAFNVNSNFIGGGNNYGFRGAIPSGTGRYNLYMDGTAQNYMAGALSIGTTATGIPLYMKSFSANSSSIRLTNFGSTASIFEVYELASTAGRVNIRQSNNVDYFVINGDGTTYQTTGVFGLLTNTPTHTLTLGSASTGLASYNTSDQTTNYERVRQYWNANEYQIASEKGGAGTQRPIRITGQLVVDGNVFLNSNQISAAIINAGILTHATNGLASFRGDDTRSAGTINKFDFVPTFNQTGTAGYTALRISPYEQSVGSGAKNLLDVGTNSASNGSGTHTSKFSVSNTGLVRAITMNISLLPTYATEIDATTGGLVTGDLYKTTTGELRIKL